VGNDPVNLIDPTGEDSYLVSRPLDDPRISSFGHAYIVIGANYIGDPEAIVISFGELENGSTGNVSDETRASERSITANSTDRRHWTGLSEQNDGNEFSRIDAKDSTVTAVVGAFEETGDYDPIPGPDLFGGAPATNSNSSAIAVANQSTETSGGEETAVPSARPLPGRNESGRVTFDKQKLCASDGIICK
jgi:hypothetical protein